MIAVIAGNYLSFSITHDYDCIFIYLLDQRHKNGKDNRVMNIPKYKRYKEIAMHRRLSECSCAEGRYVRMRLIVGTFQVRSTQLPFGIAVQQLGTKRTLCTTKKLQSESSSTLERHHVMSSRGVVGRMVAGMTVRERRRMPSGWRDASRRWLHLAGRDRHCTMAVRTVLSVREDHLR